MQLRKLRSNLKKILGGKTKMEKKKFSSLGTILMFVMSVFAGFVDVVPVVSAANGDGVLLHFKPEVASVLDPVTLEIEFYNNGAQCIDEIMVTPPDTWTGTADVSVFQKAGNSGKTVNLLADDPSGVDGTCVDLIADDQSVQIIPDSSICQGETVYFEVSGLFAPPDEETSEIKIWTSDEDSDVGPSCIRQEIADNPEVIITNGRALKVEYFRVTDFTASGFKGRAWGADARLKELAVNAGSAGNLQIVMETGSTDTTIFQAAIGPGDQWIVMDYPTLSNTLYNDGYLLDQDGARDYYITFSGTSLSFLGAKDEILDDPILLDSGLAGANGKIVTAGSSEERKVLLQLVDENGFDVNEGIPIHLDLDPTEGSVLETAPYTTESDGNAFFTFVPACMYGVVEFYVYTDPITTPGVMEYIGVNAGAPYSYEVTAGEDANVPAGESELIEVTVYDECGNVVTNTDQVQVGFDYMTTDCPDALSIDRLADTPGVNQNNHHQEMTDMGVADAYLVTDCNLCTHDVQLTVSGLGVETINLFGVNGLAAAMKVTIDEDEITAIDCVDALIEVVDSCDNRVAEIPSEVGDHMEQWESIVRVTIEDPLPVDQKGWHYSGNYTHISSYTGWREVYNYGNYIQGKLTDGAAEVTICGCMGLGTFNVVAESDTIESGDDMVSVINADPDCIETTIGDEQLLQCDTDSTLDVAIKDTCGNYWRNQGCNDGEQNYCVDLQLGGTCLDDSIGTGAELSTSTVCVPVGQGDPGYTETPIDISRLTDECCELQVTASRGAGCCNDYGTLPQCEVSSMLFHGEPDYMTSQWYDTRRECFESPDLCPPGTPCTPKDDVWCIEHLGEPIDDNGYAVVGEEVLDLFTVYDECGHIVKDFDGYIDVKKENEDCTSIYQVDSPFTVPGAHCDGDLDCSLLTPYGQDVCEDDANACSWEQLGGSCAGTPSCADIGTNYGQGSCEAWGCVWNDGTDECEGDPDFECEVPPAGSTVQTNSRTCANVGCEWTDNYNCIGNIASCSPFDESECEGLSRYCTWINECSDPGFDEVVKKLVFHNCADETVKQWTPLELEDIMVDKLAFQINHEENPDQNVSLYIYMESEQSPGFDISEDILVGIAPVSPSGPTIVELNDASLNPWLFDDQREGGVLVRAGDSKDFYLRLVSGNNAVCGEYSADYLFYQDYTSADYTDFGCGYPDLDGDGIVDEIYCGGVVRDGCINSDNYNFMTYYPHPVFGMPVCGPGTMDSRNDDFVNDAPHYVGPTPDYGFGDTVIYELKFSEGQAWTKQRDLTAETITDTIMEVISSGDECNYDYAEIELRNNPETINFREQLATQIKLINHDMGEEKVASCSEDEWEASENAFHLNIQTADGFDNPHAKSVDVKMDYCLKAPFGSEGITQMMRAWCIYEAQCTYGFCDMEQCEALYMDSDHCYTREEFKDFIQDFTEIGEYMGGILFEDFLGEEIAAWIDSYFDNAEVRFWQEDPLGPGYIPLDGDVVTTDSNGQAQVWVTANANGYYKIKATPLALDAATAMVEFTADIPEYLDIAALPSFGVPADGEQEALLLLRALDECGNIVHEEIDDVTVSAVGDIDDQVIVSQDFEGLNNHDNSVTGTLYSYGPLGFTRLAVMDDYPETATITASCEGGCLSIWGLESDTTEVVFQGAPVKLDIVDISPSDRIPADGQTGAWVTIQVQDMNGNRVTTYNGQGMASDPGDPFGEPSYVFENICVDLDDADADYPWTPFNEIDPEDMFVDDRTLGWFNWGGGDSWYCGDLAFGEGKIHVVLDPEHCLSGSATVQVKVRDDYPYQGQEVNENGLPVSLHNTQLDPVTGEIDFVSPATQWEISVDRLKAPADGETPIRVDVQIANDLLDVRQSVGGNLFLSDVEGQISWDGVVDGTSMRFVTDPLTGKTQLEVTSEEEGVAELAVTGGKAYICRNKTQLGYVCPTCETVYEKFDCYYTNLIELEPASLEVEFTKDYRKVELEEGWNFMSIPWILDTPDIDDATADIIDNMNTIWYYDASGTMGCPQNWCLYDGPGGFDDLTELEPGKGYWVDMSAADTLNLVGSFLGDNPLQLPPTYDVFTGWNSIGFHSEATQTADTYLKSLNGDWSSLYEYVDGVYTKVLPEDIMVPGLGYWLYVDQDGNIAI